MQAFGPLNCGEAQPGCMKKEAQFNPVVVTSHGTLTSSQQTSGYFEPLKLKVVRFLSNLRPSHLSEVWIVLEVQYGGGYVLDR